jgi:hypothetical protein
MIIAAATEAAHADALIGECRFDDAEHWIKEAVRLAKDARSNNPLERDVAGSAVGQMNIKLDEFRERRKTWDHAAADAGRLLAENHPGRADALLKQAAVPPCDQRFVELRAEIASHSQRATELIRKGDEQAVRYPRTAHDYYTEAAAIDPDQPGLSDKLFDTERRIPGYCANCVTRTER